MFDNKKFTEIIKKSNYTSAKLSNELMKIGVKLTKNSIDSYRKGGIKNPPIDKLSAIADLLNVDVNNFFNVGDKIHVKKVKIVGLTSCGLPLPDTYQASDEFVYVSEDIYSPDIYALKCCGDSMSPEIEDLDTVVCKPVSGIDDLKNGDLVHYTLQNESAVKIYYRDKDNFFIQFIPYNKSDDFRTINIRLDGDKIHYLKMAKVIAIIKQNINNRQSRLKLAGVL